MKQCPRCDNSLVACYPPEAGVLRCSGWPHCGYLYVPVLTPRWWQGGARGAAA